MITGSETIKGGFDVVANIRGLTDLLEAYYRECAEAGRPADADVVGRIAARIANAANFAALIAQE